MLERTVLRLGGAAAMLGAAIGFVFNVLHPRPSDYSIGAEIELVADSGIWLFDHWMLGWSIVFSFVGLAVIARSFREEPAASWGRVAFAAAAAGAALGIATIVVDGMAMKEAALNAAGGGEAAQAAAEAVAYVGMGLFTGLIGFTFGLQPVLFGIAGIVSDQYPRWLGYLAVVAGVLGFVGAATQFLTGLSTFTVVGMFLPASLGFTVYIFVMGWHLWQRADVPAAAAQPLT